MLYLLIGSDTARAKARALSLASDAEVVRFGEGGEPFENAMGYLAARGLFAPEVALIIDRPSESAEGKALLAERLTDFADAAALVAVIEPVLDAATKKKIPKKAKIETFDAAEQPREEAPNVFALTDAFASGDRKTAWVLYRKLIAAGAAPEEIHGALSWQSRAIATAAKAESASDAGLKPFVYSKAKRAGARFSPEESPLLSRELVHILYQARSGRGSLEALLESFLLKKL